MRPESIEHTFEASSTSAAGHADLLRERIDGRVGQ
jgi:hypothetical protein